MEEDAVLGDEVVSDVAREFAGPTHIVVQLHPKVKEVQHAQLPEHVVRVPAHAIASYAPAHVSLQDSSGQLDRLCHRAALLPARVKLRQPPDVAKADRRTGLYILEFPSSHIQ